MISSVWWEVAKLTASDGAIGDRFGHSVSWDYDTLVVGAPLATVDGDGDRGAAYIFRNVSGNTFSAGTKVTLSDGGAGDRVGLSVSTKNGNRALIGAPGRSAYQGAAYLFTESPVTWVRTLSLGSTAPHPNENFGVAVAMSSSLYGDTMWVGAPGTISAGLTTGSAQLFSYSSGGLLIIGAKLIPDAGTANEGFGASISLSMNGNQIAIGSPYATVDAISSAGCVRVYRAGANATASQVGVRFVSSAAQSNANLGFSVAIENDRLLAGAPYANMTNIDSGGVSSFRVKTTRGDINDSGRSDVVWFDPVNGSIAGWLMNGLVRESGATLNTGLGSTAEYCGLGDFFGDGKQCVLVRLKSSGIFKLFRLNGLSITSSSNISGGIGPEWRFLACADINGDGKSDVLLKHASTGQVNGWLMNGFTKTLGGTIGNADGREFLGTGDFDGNGTDDIFWRRLSEADHDTEPFV